MAPTFVYTAIFTFVLASGQPLEADDGNYSSYEACMLQAEADAKGMAREWAWVESSGHIQPFKGVTVRCEKRPAPKAGKGKRHGK